MKREGKMTQVKEILPETITEDQEKEQQDNKMDIEKFEDPKEEIRPQGQSTPKNIENWFKGMETIDQFWAMKKILSSRMDIVERLLKQDLKSGARFALNDIKNDWKNFEEKFGAVLMLTDENQEEYCNLFQHVSNRYYQALEEIGEQSGQIMNKQITLAPIKLEPLKIPTFDGTYENWPSFQNLFETLIIRNESLSGIERMQYLKSVLIEIAERVIAHLDVTEDNFEIAWAILCERFDNKRAIVDGQMTSILELERVDGSSTQELRKFYDNSKAYFEMLKDIPTDQLLVYILKSKLDVETRHLYEQQIEDNEINVSMEAFLKFINKRCRVLEAVNGNNFEEEVDESAYCFNACEAGEYVDDSTMI